MNVMENLRSVITQEINIESSKVEREPLHTVSNEREKLYNSESQQLVISDIKEIIINNDQNHINSDIVFYSNDNFELNLKSPSSEILDKECQLNNCEYDSDKTAAEKQTYALMDSQNQHNEPIGANNDELYCQCSPLNSEFHLSLNDENKLIIKEIPLNTNIPDFVQNLAINLKAEPSSNTHALVCIQTSDNKMKKSQSKGKVLEQRMLHTLYEMNAQPQLANEVPEARKKKMVHKMVECNEMDEQLDLSEPPKKKRKYKKRRSRSCDSIIERARKYLLDHPKCININDPSLYSYQSVRENMERNKDDYISQRVLALVVEEVYKDHLKDQLFSGIVNGLNRILDGSSQSHSKDPVSSDTLLLSVEKLLNDIEL